MRVKYRARAEAVIVAVAGGIAFMVCVPGALALAGVTAVTAGKVTPAGPGGTWGQALAVPGAAALAADGTQFDGGDATAISCSSPGNCSAVGSFTSYDPTTGATTTWPLVVTETDGAWGQAGGLQGIASISSGLGGELTAISCASVGNCSATGTYGPVTASFGFLANEVDGSWGPAQAVPGAASLGTQGFGLTAISCASAGNCTAIGGAFGAPFILDEINGTWSDPLPVPGLASLSAPADPSTWDLTSVSCPATGDCTVIGTARGSGGQDAGFVVTQTGGSWGDATLIPGQAALSSQLFSSGSLSCPAVGDCTMTGIFEPADGGYLTWVDDEAGGTWESPHEVAAPAPTERMTGTLSCATPGNCALGGTYVDARGLHHSFVASEMDGTWQAAQNLPGLPATTSVTDAISCAAPGDCTASGSYEISGRYQEYAASEANGTWGAATALPGLPAAGPRIDGLSCTAPGYCSAVGYLTGELSLIGEATGTATTMTVAAAKVTYGNEQAAPVTVTVTSPAGGTPTGTVTVTPGPASGMTGCTVTLAGGTGGCTLPSSGLAAGPYQLTATYNGDTTYAASASAIAPLTVTPAATTTSMTLSAARAPYGHESAIRVSVVTTSQYKDVVTGPVDIQAGTQTVCWLNLTGGRASCLLPDTALRVGTSRLTADAYLGGNFSPSVSADQSVTIVKGSDTTTLRLSRAAVTYGHENEEKLSVRVSPQFHGTPGGKVTIRAGKKTVCVITLRAGAGSCILAKRELRARTYQLVASYRGNRSFAGSAAKRRTLKIRRAA